MKVLIIDYKLSNLHSVQAACDAVGLDAEITSDPKKLHKAGAIILPGVGSFGKAMNNIRELELDKPIKDFVDSGKPFFGVCLGLQLLFESSEEFGINSGLSILEGKVKKFKDLSKESEKFPIPQIGWNKIYSQNQDWKDSYLQKCCNSTYMYFVHSFYVEPKYDNIILSKTSYGGQDYCSSVQKDNIFATQFHPEKSGEEGLSIYRTFKIFLRNSNDK